METTIISNLAKNEKYARKVLPYLEDELFYEKSEKILFSIINEYVNKYNSLPTNESMFIDLDNMPGLSEDDFSDTKQLIRDLKIDETTDDQWLLDRSEEFVQDRRLTNALRKSIKVLDKDAQITRSAIPGLLQEALSVSFDSQIGHDYLKDYAERWESYHNHAARIPFNIDYLNIITGGGLPLKTLSCILAPTGVGKSLVMSSLAAGNLLDQRNVLYITLEMAAMEGISQRIDANMLDIPIKELVQMPESEYNSRMKNLNTKTKGRLIVKEYPTASAGAGHFRHLLEELRIKKNFVPEVVYIDYINLCTSTRIKAGTNTNSYAYIKSIAEELRGLAVEENIAMITATQTNRSAMNASDIDLDQTADSVGLPATVDFMIALISTEELEEMNQMMIKQLKNRHGDMNINKRFVVGVNKSKMKIYDADPEEQENILDGPVMDTTEFGVQDNERNKQFKSNKFKGFN